MRESIAGNTSAPLETLKAMADDKSLVVNLEKNPSLPQETREELDSKYDLKYLEKVKEHWDRTMPPRS